MKNELHDVVGTIGKCSAEIDRMKRDIQCTISLILNLLTEADCVKMGMPGGEERKTSGGNHFVHDLHRSLEYTDGTHWSWNIVYTSPIVNNEGVVIQQDNIKVSVILSDAKDCFSVWYSGRKTSTANKDIPARYVRVVYDSLNDFMSDLFSTYPSIEEKFATFLDDGSK